MAERMSGVVTRVFLTKGYGFLRGRDGVSRFIHASEVKPMSAFDHMHEGQAVEFEPSDDGPSDKGEGKRAVRVTFP